MGTKIWLTADSHLYHKNIIGYCNRPFLTIDGQPDIELMNYTIVENWNRVVAPEDVVYHLGDFALGSGFWVKHYANRLKGKKILILGNHDRHSKKLYQDAGFEVHKHYVLEHGAHRIYLHHRPMQPKDWPSGCDMSLVGHVHGKWLYNKDFRALNVGVDVWGFTPVSLEGAINNYLCSQYACGSCGADHNPEGQCSRK